MFLQLIYAIFFKEKNKRSLGAFCFVHATQKKIYGFSGMLSGGALRSKFPNVVDLQNSYLLSASKFQETECVWRAH